MICPLRARCSDVVSRAGLGGGTHGSRASKGLIGAVTGRPASAAGIFGARVETPARADERGRSWSPYRSCSSRSGLPHRRRPGQPAGFSPTCRPPTTCDDDRAPSSTCRNGTAGLAKGGQYAVGTESRHTTVALPPRARRTARTGLRASAGRRCTTERQRLQQCGGDLSSREAEATRDDDPHALSPRWLRYSSSQRRPSLVPARGLYSHPVQPSKPSSSTTPSRWRTLSSPRSGSLRSGTPAICR